MLNICKDEKNATGPGCHRITPKVAALAYHRAQHLRVKSRTIDQWEQEEGLEAHFDPHDYDFVPASQERYFE